MTANVRKPTNGLEGRRGDVVELALGFVPFREMVSFAADLLPPRHRSRVTANMLLSSLRLCRLIEGGALQAGSVPKMESEKQPNV